MKILEMSLFILSMMLIFVLYFTCFLPWKSLDLKKNFYSLLSISIFWIAFEAIRYFSAIESLVTQYGPLFVFVNVLRTGLMAFSVSCLFKGQLIIRVMLTLQTFFLADISEGVQQLLLTKLIGPENIEAFVMAGHAWILPNIIQLMLVGGMKLFKRKGIYLEKNVALLELLVLIACQFISMSMLPSLIMKSTNGTDDAVDHVGFFLYVGLVIIIFMAFEFTNAIYAKKREYQLKEERHEFLEDYYKEIEQQQLKVRRIKHDMNNQLLVLKGQLSSRSYLDAKKQLDHCLKELEQ